MKSLARFAEWFIREPLVHPQRDRFDVAVVSPLGERFNAAELPFELRYACERLSGAEERLRAFFERGYGLGVRTMPRAPVAALQAVDRISSISQEGTSEPWLSRLIFNEEIPVFSDDDIAEAHARGCHLLTDAHVILSERHPMIRIVAVDLEAHGIEDADAAFVSELNRAIEPIAAAYLHHRILLDRRSDVPSPFRLFAITALLVAPAAHLVAMFAQGLGRLVAAIADDVIRESSELVLLRNSGFTRRQAFHQGAVYVPVLFIAIILLIAVNGLIDGGAYGAAGFVFGLSAVSFPVIRLLQRVADRRTAYLALHRMRKLSHVAMPSTTGMAIRDVASRPDAVGLAIGILIAPCAASIAFLAAPTLVADGWFLAFLAALDTFVAIAVIRLLRAWSRASFIRRITGILAKPPDEPAFRAKPVDHLP